MSKYTDALAAQALADVALARTIEDQKHNLLVAASTFGRGTFAPHDRDVLTGISAGLTEILTAWQHRQVAAAATLYAASAVLDEYVAERDGAGS